MDSLCKYRLKLFLISACLAHVKFIDCQQLLSIPDEKCFESPWVTRWTNDVRAYVIQIYELFTEYDELVSEDINATLSVSQRLKKAIAELQMIVKDLPKSPAKKDERIQKMYTGHKSSENCQLFMFGDTVYFVSDFRLTWLEAWSFCRSKGALLVNIPNSTISRYLISKLDPYNGDFWIGGIWAPGGYLWRTEFGYSPMTWSNWAPGEPNRKDQNCVQLWKNAGHKWDDYDCEFRKTFICSRTLP
ncbi:hypothetical protein FSP39_012191 [Pinctada imbricata]|uniref:C-type lectin domain-containing protein n=1 Tax=Pinctada imbricata TaxID=66713 RepID=A0AA89BWA4_PINIB|nr:hypothetical protein FSP39_012191 [Pinctada imbricata]